MAESMSSPWVHDYLMQVAQTYGTQLYNAPLLTRKKKVQLTDFLTYQEDSYVWAWISDKNHKVSVRISKDAADQYKAKHHRSIIDCRFSLVSVGSYRPMFSPRPLGPNATGNTPVSHLALEIGYIYLVGVGGHLFGTPCDLESDESMREWVLGLRQDGGGGNVLKLRKQQELAQTEKAQLSPPTPPLISLPAPISPRQATRATDDAVKTKSEQPHDFRREYAKRWRMYEADPLILAAKPAAAEQLDHTEFAREPPLDAVKQLESRELPACPTSPHRTPSPGPKLPPQGTPTEWSPSNRGSSVAPADTSKVERAPGNGIQQPDELGDLSTALNLSSDMEEHATIDTAIVPDARSPQSPTPAQRIKQSPLPHSSLTRCDSPGASARSSPRPSQQLPCSSPPPPSSSLLLPSLSLPIPTNVWKNIQHKVPYPGLPVARPGPTSQGPVQILVPNSDSSGPGSSQLHSQSQRTTQSQQSPRQLLTHSLAFPSSLTQGFKPADESTPRERNPSSTRDTSKMFAESLFTQNDIEGQEVASIHDEPGTEKPETSMGNRTGLGSPQAPALSAPKIEVLEVGTSETEEEADQLQTIHSTPRVVTALGRQTAVEDMSKEVANVEPKHEDNQLPGDKTEIHSASRSNSPRRPFIQVPSLNGQDSDGVSVHHPPQSSEPQTPIHSLFSCSVEDAQSSRAPTLLVSQTEPTISEDAPLHDSEAWKEPSFLARSKGKGKAHSVRESDSPGAKVGKKRRRSTRSKSPVPKRSKVAAPDVLRVASDQIVSEVLQPKDTGASVIGSSSRPSVPSTSTADTAPTTASQSPKPRLANFAVDCGKIDGGKGVPMPRVNVDKDMKNILLRTGRIRTLGKKVEDNGRAYIMK